MNVKYMSITPAEQAFADLLRRAVADPALHRAAQEAAQEALDAWELPAELRGLLLADAAAADARLALIRAGLLHELSGLEGVMPHAALLRPEAFGGFSWLGAIEAALTQVTGGGASLRQEARRGVKPASSHQAAVDALRSVSTRASAPYEVVNDRAGVVLELSRETRSYTLRWDSSSEVVADVDVATWRALHALAAGLYAAERIGMGLTSANVARRELAWPLRSLIAREVTAQEAVNELDDRLVAPLSPEVPAWPRVFETIARTLDGLADLDGDAWPSLERGLWVEVVAEDPSEPGPLDRIVLASTPRQAGDATEDPSEPGPLGRVVQPGTPWQRGDARGASYALVEVDGQERRIRIGDLRTPPRRSLLG